MPLQRLASRLTRHGWRRRRTVMAALLIPLLMLLALAPAAGPARAQGAIQLSFTSLSRAPASELAGAVTVPMLALTVSISAGSELLRDLLVERTGTADDGDVRDEGVRIWWDTNGNGVVDGVDTLLSSRTFRGGVVRLQTEQPVPWLLPVQIIITLELHPDATGGATIGVSIADSSAVTTLGESIIAGAFPLASSLMTIVGPGVEEVPVEATATVSQSEGATITSPDGKVDATIPAGAAPNAITVTLVNVPGAGLPERPGEPAGEIYRAEWTAVEGETPKTLSSPVRIELDLADLIEQGIKAADLHAVALGDDGVWRTLPTSLSVDGSRIIFSVSTRVTFSLVVLNGAVADLVPPSGGTVAAADGSASATVPADASETPLLISLTPSTAPAPALSESSQAVGTPIVFEQQNPVTGEPGQLNGPITVSLELPDTTGVPGCETGCDIVAYGVPADGGVPVPLPTRRGANGLEVLVEVTANVTIVLVTGPDVAAGQVPAGEAGTVATANESTRAVAAAGATTLDITIAPVSAVDSSAAGLSDILAGRPVHVAYAADGTPGAARRPTVVEIDLGTLDSTIDPARLQAYGSPAGGGVAPTRLPNLIDQAGGVIRIALETSMTIYVVDDAAGTGRAVPLNPGWNLVNYSGPDGTPVEFINQALGNRAAAIHRWDAANARYDSYIRGLPQAPMLAQVNSEDALWIFISGDTVAWGLPTPPPAERGVVLHPGWNLVSWSGPDVSAADLLALIGTRLRSAFVWQQEVGKLVPFLLAVGPPLPVMIATRDAIWILIDGVTPLVWDQPGVGVE